MPLNSPVGSSLQCDTQLWDHYIEFASGSTLQYGSWLCDDVSLNSPI